MQRSGGVTAIAITQMAGSALVFLCGLFFCFAMLVVPLDKLPPEQQAAGPVLRVMGGVFAVVGALFCAWGITTAIGLLKLRPWARISTLIYSGILTGFTVLFALGVAVAPLRHADSSQTQTQAVVKIIMVAFFLLLSLFGVWWTVYLTRPGVKAQFYGEGTAAPPSVRPVSISIIGWWKLVTAAFTPFSALIGWPIPVMVWVATGWTARLIYLSLGIAYALVGRGLLKLRPWARISAIAIFGFFAVDTLVYRLAPGAAERHASILSQMPFHAASGRTTPILPVWFSIAVAVMFNLLPLIFLIKNGAAFAPLAAPPLPPPPPTSPLPTAP